MLPVYKIGIDDKDLTTGFDYNAIVDYPAHMRTFDAYGKVNAEYFIEEEKMRITGVLISVDTLIYRNDKTFGEHLVIFDKAETEKLWIRNNELENDRKANKQHDSKDVVDQSQMFKIEEWIVDYANNKGVPKNLVKQNIKDGSLMRTYQIRDSKLWKEIKMGKVNGFSIEGMFMKWPVNTKKVSDNQMLMAMKAVIKEIKNNQKK